MYHFAVVALFGLAVLKLADLLVELVPSLGKTRTLLTFALAIAATVAVDYSLFTGFGVELREAWMGTVGHRRRRRLPRRRLVSRPRLVRDRPRPRPPSVAREAPPHRRLTSLHRPIHRPPRAPQWRGALGASRPPWRLGPEPTGGPGARRAPRAS